MLHIFKLTKYTRLLNTHTRFCHAYGLLLTNLQKEKVGELFPESEDEFPIRHIGPRQHEQLEMLETIGFKVVFLFNNKNVNFFFFK